MKNYDNIVKKMIHLNESTYSIFYDHESIHIQYSIKRDSEYAEFSEENKYFKWPKDRDRELRNLFNSIYSFKFEGFINFIPDCLYRLANLNQLNISFNAYYFGIVHEQSRMMLNKIIEIILIKYGGDLNEILNNSSLLPVYFHKLIVNAMNYDRSEAVGKIRKESLKKIQKTYENIDLLRQILEEIQTLRKENAVNTQEILSKMDETQILRKLTIYVNEPKDLKKMLEKILKDSTINTEEKDRWIKCIQHVLELWKLVAPSKFEKLKDFLLDFAKDVIEEYIKNKITSLIPY